MARKRHSDEDILKLLREIELHLTGNMSRYMWSINGIKFADAELIGIPHRLVVSERSLAAGELEYRHRRESESRNVKRDEALAILAAG